MCQTYRKIPLSKFSGMSKVTYSMRSTQYISQSRSPANNKDKILKFSREKGKSSKPKCLSSPECRFLDRILKDKVRMVRLLQYWRKKNLPTNNTMFSKATLQTRGGDKDFSRQSWGNLKIIKFVLAGILRGALHSERKMLRNKSEISEERTPFL